MIGNFQRCSDTRLKELFESPENIEEFLYPEEESEDENPNLMDIDKAWHGIHFLLCDSIEEGNPPLDFIVGSGSEIGDIDVGYGPARGFSSGEVKSIHDALSKISDEDLQKKFDPQEFSKNDIYPAIWDEPKEEILDEYLLAYLSELREFIAATVSHKKSNALIVYIN